MPVDFPHAWSNVAAQGAKSLDDNGTSTATAGGNGGKGAA